MRPILVFLVLLTLSLLNSKANSISVSGNVAGDWNVDTVRVMSDILLQDGDSLVIHPGVLVEFHGPYSFYVGGFMHALGTPNDRITFDVADTTGFSVDSIPDGGWNGIQFYYTTVNVDSSIFDHCIFRHGKAVSADTLENHGGAICVRYFDKIRISRCLFEDNFAALNGGAIYLEGGSVRINQNEFLNNRCGPADSPWGYGGAICSDLSSPLISNNYFEGNSSTGVGGAAAIRFQDAAVNSNIFTQNYSALGGAIGYLHYYEYPFSQCNNLMYNNSSDFFGGAIASLDAGPTFVNNTVTGNYSTYGGGFYVKDSIVPDIYNSIFWDNQAAVGPEVYLWDAYASANFYYCDVEGGPELFGGSGGGAGYTGEYRDNLDLNPLFEYPSNNDFHLSLNSPVQNMGTPDTTGLRIPSVDLDGELRIDIHAQVIDMGCYELQWVGLGPDWTGSGRDNAVIYPNPAADHLIIQSSSVISKIQVLDSTGTMIMEVYPAMAESFLQTNELARGIYLIKIYSDEGMITRKVVVAK